MKSSIRLYATAVVAALVLLSPVMSIGCGSSSPAAPSPAPSPTPTPTPRPTPAATVETLAAPVPVSPTQTAQVTTVRPTLTVTNATIKTSTVRSAAKPASTVQADSTVQPDSTIQPQAIGPLHYTFQISESTDFPANETSFNYENVAEGADGTTSLTVTINLKGNQIYFWRAFATDGTVASPFSALESFQTALTLSPPIPVSPIGGAQVSSDKPVLTATNSTASAGVGTVTYTFQVSESASFPANSTSSNYTSVPAGAGGRTSFTVPGSLKSNTAYFWRVSSTDGTVTSEFSRVETFKTLGSFKNGANVFDLLTDGTTVGNRIGGHFELGPNGGWQADSKFDGLDYDIPTTPSGTIEFDITNIGRGEGAGFSPQADAKFLSMGDGSAFGGFQSFRDHPWKMHFIQRGDGDGTGLEIIWRNGGNGDGDPGDHRIKMGGGGPPFDSNRVFHVVIRWDPGGYQISVDGILYLENSFRSGFPYAPPNHRVSLGCYPRGESLPGRWRNVKITPN